MRVPPPQLFTHWLRYIGIFICGIVVGSALFMSIYQHNFNEMYIWYSDELEQNDKLRIENESYKMNKNKQVVIQKIAVTVEKEPGAEALDEVIVTEIVRMVQNDLKQFIGIASASIATNPQFARMSIDGNFYPKIHEKDYIIRLNTLIVVQTDLQIWISIKEFTRNSSRL